MDEIARHLPPWLLWSVGAVGCLLVEFLRGGGPYLIAAAGAAAAAATGAVGAPAAAQAAAFALGAGFAWAVRAVLRAIYLKKS